jgi:hypothetical protein
MSTQDGPIAWCSYFDTSPAFFMSVNGQLPFPTGAVAIEGTQKFVHTIRNIELKGGDLRVDALTPELAVVGVTWREVQVDNDTPCSQIAGMNHRRSGCV